MVRRPDFFIVGAPRCGTTALYEYLRQHPEVYMPYRKEPVFFGSDLTKRPPYLTEEGYLRLFAGAGNEPRVGEATAWYLYSQTAPSEIREFSPDARIIIMLRNPVDMMHSLHGLLVFTGNEDIIDFSAALDAEADRREGRRIPSHVRRPEGLLYRRCAAYAPHVRRYLETFGPARVRVILFEDLRDDSAAVYRETLNFLEVDPTFAPTFAVVNPSKRPRSALVQRAIYSRMMSRMLRLFRGPAYHVIWRALMRLNSQAEPRPPVSPELQSRLSEEMAPSIHELEAVLGRDLGGWLQTHVDGSRTAA